MVGTERIELSRVAPHAPQACAYTNSATSPDKFSNDSDKHYFLTFAGLFAALTAVFAAVFAGVATFETFVIGGTVTAESAFAFVLAAAFASTLAFVFVAGVSLEVSLEVSGFVVKTEVLPVSAGIESIKADNIKSVAATMVVFDKTVAVPRVP